MFGFEIDDGKSKCPGEEKCGLFRIAFNECGDGSEVCRPSDGGKPCELLPTKPKNGEGESSADSAAVFLSKVRYLRTERLSNGGVIDKRFVTAIEHRAVTVYDSYFENAKVQNDAMQRKLAEENNQMLMVVLQIKKR